MQAPRDRWEDGKKMYLDHTMNLLYSPTKHKRQVVIASQKAITPALAAYAASPSPHTYYTFHPVGPICLRVLAFDIPHPQTVCQSQRYLLCRSDPQRP